MSLKFLTNLNSAPYYDDFDVDKKFLKILFNPKLPVQVRELVQIQSILSDQLSRLGDSSLVDGTMVIDGNFNVDTNVEYIKLKPLVPSNLNNSNNIHTSAQLDIKDISSHMSYSLSITDDTGGPVSQVEEGQHIHFILNTSNVPDGTEIPYRIEGISEDDIDIDLTGYFVVNSNKSNIGANISVDYIDEGLETLKIIVENNLVSNTSDSTAYEILSKTLPNFKNRIVRGKISGAKFFVREVSLNDQNDENTIYGYHITGNKKLLKNEEIETVSESGLHDYYAIINDDSEFTGKSSFATVNSGIFYVAGMFHIVDSQEIILEKYNDNPKYRIGLELIEKIIDYSDDSSLLDNANGTPNKNAPGADRFSVDLLLKKETYDGDLDTTVIKNSGCQFYEFVRTDGSRRINISKKFPFTYLAKAFAKERKKQGDRVVKPFHMDIDPSGSKLNLNFSPGKAYVNGFLVETNSKKTIEIDKGRDVGIVENDYISFEHGNYFYVEIPTPLGTIAGRTNVFPSFLKHEQLSLYDTTSFTRIGQLKIKFIDFDSYDIATSTAVYKLYFYDLEMNPIAGGRYNVSDIVYFQTSNFENPGIFKINAKSTKIDSITSGTTKTFVSKPKENDLIFDVSEKSIKKITKFKFMTVFSKSLNHSFSSLSYTLESNQKLAKEFSGLTNFTLNSIIDKYLIVLNKKTGVRYDNLSVTTSNEDDLIQEISITITGPSFPLATDQLEVVFKCFTDTSSYRTKTKKSKTYITGIPAVWPLSLDNVDVISIDSIKIGGIDHTQDFTLDKGLKDNYYDFSKISPVPGATWVGPTIEIRYNYFEHGSNEGFFTPETYLNIGVDVEEYVSEMTGKSYDLTNCIDFRPSVDPRTGSIEFSSIPVDSDEVSSISYERYLGRIDKVVLDENRDIQIIRGKPEVFPKIPDDSKDKLTLYTLSIPPYTKTKNEIDIVPLECDKDKDLELVIEKSKNHQLVQMQNGMTIYKTGLFVDNFSDHSHGDINSSSYNCSIDYSNKELRNSFSSQSRKMSFNKECSVFTDPCNETSSDIIQKGPYVMSNYSEVEFLVNPLISQSTLVNPHKSISWHGDLKIFPTVDRWYDNTVKPEILSNIEGKNNNWEIDKGFGYQWNDWEDRWFGNQELKSIPENMLKNKENSSKRRDISNFIKKPNKTKSCEKETDKIREIIHYSNSTRVYFISDNLKPNTEFYGFLDDVEVFPSPAHILNVENTEGFIDDYANGEDIELWDRTVIPEVLHAKAKILRISSEDSKKLFIYNRNIIIPLIQGLTVVGKTSGKTTTFNSEENPVTPISNSIGELCGYFTVPTNTKVGEKIFRLNDVQTYEVTESSSVSETSFFIQGKIEETEKNIKSTRPYLRKRSHMNVENSLYEDVYSREYLMPFKENNLYLENVDYLSQSFEVNKSLFKDGLFLSSIDLFFKNKDNYLPVSVEIRPMVNGYPSPNTILPFSQVTLASKDVTVSSSPNFELEHSHNTRFTFDVPVFLVPGEYSIVVKGGGYNYELWSCENGKSLIGDHNEDCYNQMIVTQQPNVGEMFSSHNSGIYQSVKNQHLAFRLNRCEFLLGKFKACFESVYKATESFNLFNFQVNLLEDFEDVSGVKFEYENVKGEYKEFEKNRNIELVDPITINAIDTSAGDLFKVTSTWESSNSLVSPVFDIETMNLITVKNSFSGGTYISKIVHLEDYQESKDIRVFLDAYKPYGNIIDVYYKIGNSNDILDFDSKLWNRMELIQPTERFSKNKNDYFEMEFGNISGVNLSQEQYNTFNIFSIKVELKNNGTDFTDNQYFPRVKDLRVICLKDPVGIVSDYELLSDRTIIYEDLATAPAGQTNTVVFTLNTTNLPNGTLVPYTLSGIQSVDIGRPLTGNFVIAGNTANITVTMVPDAFREAESITCSLRDVLPFVYKTVFVVDGLPESYDIRFVDCLTGTIINNSVDYCNNRKLCIQLGTVNVPVGTSVDFVIDGLPHYEIIITDDDGNNYGSGQDACNHQTIGFYIETINVPEGQEVPFIITGLPEPEYNFNLTADPTFVLEGGSVEVTLTTDAPDDFYYYTIRGISSSDIDQPLTGYFNVLAGKASITLDSVEDYDLEIVDVLNLALDNGKADIDIRIYDDAQIELISDNQDSSFETEKVTIELITDLLPGERISYTITGDSENDITEEDILEGLTGEFILDSFGDSFITLTLNFNEDNNERSFETFTLSLDNGLGSIDVRINEPDYKLSVTQYGGSFELENNSYYCNIGGTSLSLIDTDFADGAEIEVIIKGLPEGIEFTEN